MVRFHSVITFFVVCYESKRCNDYVPRDDGSGGGVWRVAGFASLSKCLASSKQQFILCFEPLRCAEKREKFEKTINKRLL